ncbi:MAG: tRNA pseudouridine(55) synthase TruB [Pyrinomonadaceae bacterium]
MKKIYNAFMDGVLVIDKPAGLTSHDVVARVRRLLHERRVGHTGTLDPFATGVLVVLVGRATRLAQFLSGAEKEYEAVIRLGYATDTGDFTGKPISNAAAATNNWSDQEIETALQSLQGETDQIPPMYSAKKQRGHKLYELARRGEEIERNPVRVEVHVMAAVRRGDCLLRNNEDGTLDLAVRVVCSAGTYVRTLAETFGERLGVGAHLVELRRTRAGDFHISKAVSLDQLKAYVDDEAIASILLPPDAALRWMPFADLTAPDVQRARQGIAIPLKKHSGGLPAEGENIRMRDETEKLVAVGCYDAASQALHPRVVIAVE